MSYPPHIIFFLVGHTLSITAGFREGGLKGINFARLSGYGLGGMDTWLGVINGMVGGIGVCPDGSHYFG